MVERKAFVPTINLNNKSFIIIALLLVMYFIQNSSLFSFIDSFVFNYILQPILWLSITLFIWYIPRVRPQGQLKLRRSIYQWAFIFGIMFISISFMAGLIDGLGKSPYNHSIIGILTNIIFVGSAMVGRELIRSYLVNSFFKKNNYYIVILIALLMTVTNISFKNFKDITELQSLVMFFAKTIGPEFTENLFSVYLVYLGGPFASIIYLGIIRGFHWLSPILSDLKWITTALIGILVPVFFYMLMQSIYNTLARVSKRRDQREESLASWIVTSVVSIMIIWFAVGVFPIYPSVIATGSMEPMIKPGDIILVKKIVDMDGINALNKGDIIQFQRDSILISHRIIEVVNDEEEGIQFRTKGDNNSSEDSDLVSPEDVKGTIKNVVPKIGWPTLLIKSDKDIDLEKIVF